MNRYGDTAVHLVQERQEQEERPSTSSKRGRSTGGKRGGRGGKSGGGGGGKTGGGKKKSFIEKASQVSFPLDVYVAGDITGRADEGGMRDDSEGRGGEGQSGNL